jgi:peptide chain release factor 2
LIIALENAKYELQNFRANIEELGNALRINDLKIEVEELEKVTFDPDFWSNQENSTKTLQKIKQMKAKIENFEALSTKLEDTIMMTEMAIEENDESMTEDILADQNDINEETAMQLELINQSLAELQMNKQKEDRPRKPIGFIQPE